MYSLSKLLLILVCISLFFNCLSAADPSVSSVSIEPSTYYTDSQDINLVFNVNNLVKSFEYELKLTKYANYLDPVNPPNNKICDEVLGCLAIHPPYTTYSLNPGAEASGKLKFVFKLSSIISSDEYAWELWDISCGLLPICKKDLGTETFPVEPGNPSFDISLYDLNSKQDGITVFPKSNSFELRVNNITDNTDDAGKDYIKCTYTIVGKSNTKDIVGTTPITTQTMDTFSASDLGQGTHTITVKCVDNTGTSYLFDEESIVFKIEDKLPTVDSITFLPDVVYPDTKTKCNATYSDEDDATGTITTITKWYKNGTQVTSVTGNEFDCSKNTCKSGDEIKCGVIPKNNQPGQEVYKKLDVASHFKEVKIASPYKLQINQEETYTANVTYNGSGTITYSWIFGDGTTGTGKSVKHKYATKGNYPITLNVSDDKGSTGTASVQVSTVDADLIITVKSPTLNQELVKGETLNVKASLTDNTGTPINDGNVIVNLKSGDNIFATKQTKVTNGIYEADLPVSYLTSTNLEVEFVANYKKSGISLTNKKIIPVTSTAIDSLQPIFNFDLTYNESKDNTFTVGNVITKINVCFRLPDSSLDDAMQGKLIISASKDNEYKIEELDQQCYNLYPNYKIQKEDLDTGITIKFKDAKDLYDNYVKASNVKKYEVLALPNIFDLVLVEPSIDKINYGQTVYVKAKPVVREGYKLADLKDLKGQILYAGKTYDLSYSDVNSEKVFSGSFLPNLDPQVNFKVLVSGTYNGGLAEESISKTLTATNDLKVLVLSPNESGVLDSLGKVIVSINYQNNLPYENDTITLNLNDKNTLFTKLKEGKYAGAFAADSADVGIFKSGPLELKGQDEKGNNVNYNVDIPTMAWKIPMFIYDIFAGIIIVMIGMAIIMTRISSKTKKLEKMYANKSSEELKDELIVAKQTLGELQRKFFKQEVSEDVFKTQKIELEKKISLMESKLKTEDLREQKVHEVSKEFVNNMPDNKREVLEKKLNLQSDVYTKYKEDIDTISAKLKPFKDKYSPEEMRVAIKQSKELPEDIIDKIISKIFD